MDLPDKLFSCHDAPMASPPTVLLVHQPRLGLVAATPASGPVDGGTIVRIAAVGVAPMRLQCVFGEMAPVLALPDEVARPGPSPRTRTSSPSPLAAPLLSLTTLLGSIPIVNSLRVASLCAPRRRWRSRRLMKRRLMSRGGRLPRSLCASCNPAGRSASSSPQLTSSKLSSSVRVRPVKSSRPRRRHRRRPLRRRPLRRRPLRHSSRRQPSHLQPSGARRPRQHASTHGCVVLSSHPSGWRPAVASDWRESRMPRATAASTG